MSVAAVNWAFQQPITRSSSKFILVTLANLVRHDAPAWLMFGSTDYLSKATGLNRKTVLDAMQRLREAGLIVDTGRTAGGNLCIPIYRLAGCPASQKQTPDQQAPHQGELIPEEAKEPTEPESPSSNDLQPAPLSVCQSSTFINAGAPGTPLPGVWSLPPSWRVWAKKQRPKWSDAKIDSVAAIFHAHWTSEPGQKAESQDWYAAWRRWVLRELEPKQAVGLPPLASQSSVPPDYEAIGAELRALVNQHSHQPSTKNNGTSTENGPSPIFHATGTENGL
ncbi:hypothetical protein [Castellaniella sp.]|uniref:hypothetical protein n=1 Tax=Castellaniella sp. TaxID=1955812 RepID=UPI002AFEF420|nr:hypothetical protein [Castellaniella sp.]